MKIYVDADACPVKDIIVEEGVQAGIQIIFVNNYSHVTNRVYPSNVQIICVDGSADAADYRIVKLARKGDVVVTQDYGLASLVLANGCTTLHPTGYRFNEHNIDRLLQSRHINAMIRQSGGRTKGHKPFTHEQKTKFQELLRSVISGVTHHYN